MLLPSPFILSRMSEKIEEVDIQLLETQESGVKEVEQGKRPLSDELDLLESKPAKKQRREEERKEVEVLVQDATEAKEEELDVEYCQYCRSIRLDPASKEVFNELVCEACKVFLFPLSTPFSAFHGSFYCI